MVEGSRRPNPDQSLYIPAFPVVWSTTGETGKLHSLVMVPRKQPIAITYTKPNGHDIHSLAIDITMVPEQTGHRWTVYGSADRQTLASFRLRRQREQRYQIPEITKDDLQKLQQYGPIQQIHQDQYNLFWQLTTKQLTPFFREVWQPQNTEGHEFKLAADDYRILPEKIPLFHQLKQASLRVNPIKMNSSR